MVVDTQELREVNALLDQAYNQSTEKLVQLGGEVVDEFYFKRAQRIIFDSSGVSLDFYKAAIIRLPAGDFGLARTDYHPSFWSSSPSMDFGFLRLSGQRNRSLQDLARVFGMVHYEGGYSRAYYRDGSRWEFRCGDDDRDYRIKREVEIGRELRESISVDSLVNLVVSEYSSKKIAGLA